MLQWVLENKLIICDIWDFCIVKVLGKIFLSAGNKPKSHKDGAQAHNQSSHFVPDNDDV